MSFGKLLALYGICAVVFFALDFAWLSFANGAVYKPNLGSLLLDQPKLGVAGAFYLVYVAGLIALAVVPSLQSGSVGGALWRGAVLGLLAYATYDLTNLATLKGWTWQVSAIDLAWGTAVNAAVAAVGFYAAHWLGI